MQRFWERAEAVATAGGYGVRLDGRPVSLPGGGPLLVGSAGLAEAIAAEWRAAGPRFGPDDLPLQRLAATALERVPARRAALVEQLTDYGMNDLLCYRAADEPALAAREDEAWGPWLDWAERRHGAALRTGAGIVPVAQPPAARAAFTAALRGLADAELAGLGVIVPALGSLVLGLAVAAGELDPAAACELAELDALWQAGRWGEDEAAAARRRAIAAEVAVATRFMILSRP